jgi:hypothetical protein
MPNVGTNPEVLPAAPQVQAAPVKANQHAAAVGKVKSMVSRFEKELSAGTSSAGSDGGGFPVEPRSEKEMVLAAENIADVTGGPRTMISSRQPDSPFRSDRHKFGIQK